MRLIVAYFVIGTVYGVYSVSRGRVGLYGRGGAFLFCLLGWPVVLYFESKYPRPRGR